MGADGPAADENQYHSDAGVGGGIHRETAAVPVPNQDKPRMAMHSTTDRARIEGIVAQCRADIGNNRPKELARVVAQRLKQAKIELDDTSLNELTA